MSTSPRPGRPYVLAVIACFIGISLFSILLSNLVRGSGSLGTEAVRFLLTLALCYMLYQGYVWARLLGGFLAGLAGVFGLFGGMALLATGNPGSFLVIGLAMVYVVCFVILIFIPGARAYFR